MKRIYALFALFFGIAVTASAQHTMWYVEGRGIIMKDAFSASERSYRYEGYVKHPLTRMLSLTAYGRFSRDGWSNELPDAGFVGVALRPSQWIGVEAQAGIQEYMPANSFWRLRGALFLGGVSGNYIYTKSILMVVSGEYGGGTEPWFQGLALVPLAEWLASGVYVETKYGIGPRIDLKFVGSPLRIHGAVLLREFGNSTLMKENLTAVIGMRVTM